MRSWSPSSGLPATVSPSLNSRIHHSHTPLSLPLLLSRMNNLKVIIVSVSVTIVIVLLTSLSKPSSSASSSTTTIKEDSPLSFRSSIRPYPGQDIAIPGTVVQTNESKVDFIYQLPSPSSSPPTADRFALLFHGCRHRAANFFACSHAACHGLPEEMRLTRGLLSRGYGVIAVQSTSGSCWRSLSTNNGADYDAVHRALTHLSIIDGSVNTEEIITSNKKLVTVGISSGGAFATSLVKYKDIIKATYSIISKSLLLLPKTPHAFTHMAHRDGRIAQFVMDNSISLRNEGTPVLTFTVNPQPVSVTSLKDAFPLWEDAVAERVVKKLSEGGFVDEGGFLKEDPRMSNWREVLKGMESELGEPQGFLPAMSPLEEQLNRLYAQHEACADHFEDVLNFFDEVVK